MQGSDGTDRERIATIIDLERYPIDRPGAPAFEALVSRCLDELSEDGCCVLGSFIRPRSVARMVREGEDLAPQAHLILRPMSRTSRRPIRVGRSKSAPTASCVMT
jgi:hypothetical protein